MALVKSAQVLLALFLLHGPAPLQSCHWAYKHANKSQYCMYKSPLKLVCLVDKNTRPNYKLSEFNLFSPVPSPVLSPVCVRQTAPSNRSSETPRAILTLLLRSRRATLVYLSGNFRSTCFNPLPFLTFNGSLLITCLLCLYSKTFDCILQYT